METPGPTLTKEQLAYFAGFLDGEGSFDFLRTPRVRVTNTYLPVIKELKHTFGGSWFKRGHRARSRVCYEWVVCGSKALNLVHQVLPYLKEKGHQARILCMFREYPPKSEQRILLLRSLSQLKRVEYHDNPFD